MSRSDPPDTAPLVTPIVVSPQTLASSETCRLQSLTSPEPLTAAVRHTERFAAQQVADYAREHGMVVRSASIVGRWEYRISAQAYPVPEGVDREEFQRLVDAAQILPGLDLQIDRLDTPPRKDHDD